MKRSTCSHYRIKCIYPLAQATLIPNSYISDKSTNSTLVFWMQQGSINMETQFKNFRSAVFAASRSQWSLKKCSGRSLAFYFSIQEEGTGLVIKKILQEKVADVRLLIQALMQMNYCCPKQVIPSKPKWHYVTLPVLATRTTSIQKEILFSLICFIL